MNRFYRSLKFALVLVIGLFSLGGKSAHAAPIPPLPTSSATVAAPATLTPERYGAMVKALEPLPAFGPFGKGQFPVQRVEVQTQDLLSFTLAGEEVTLWTYLIRPLYGETMDGNSMDAIIRGELGVALFTAENQLLWRSNLAAVDYLNRLEVRATALSFTPTETGLLYQWQVTFDGSGAYTADHTIIYRWAGRSFVPVWQNITGESYASGYGYHTSRGERIELRDLDQQGWPELLLYTQRSLTGVNQQDAQLTPDFRVFLPGVLVLGWDGERYDLRYFVNHDRLIPLHPQWPVRFAPRLHTPLTIDGKDDDWAQPEYLNWADLIINRDLETPGAELPYGGLVAWDECNLYLRTSATITQPIQIAIDTDLSTDFVEPLLSADDIVLTVTLEPDSLPATAKVTINHAANEIPVTVAVVPITNDNGRYQIELAIPLIALGLDAAALVPLPGWVGRRPSPYSPEGARLYYPAAGRIIGFAVDVRDGAEVHWDDPTTWPALVFMAER